MWELVSDVLHGSAGVVKPHCAPNETVYILEPGLMLFSSSLSVTMHGESGFSIVIFINETAIVLGSEGRV